MNNILRLRFILSCLSDVELSTISKSITEGVRIGIVRDQLISKGDNFGDFSNFYFTQKELTDSIINELANRLLKTNIEVGKKNKSILTLKSLFRFRLGNKK